MRYLNALLAALLFTPSLALAGASSLGEILGTEPSVRANGMGDAYTAVDGDVFGSYYNPATSARTNTAGLMFQRGYAEDSTGMAAISLPKGWGGFNLGASLLYYTAGDMDLVTNGGITKTVTSEKDYVGTVNLSRKIGLVSVGANAKLLHSALFDQTNDTTMVFDFGALADLGYVQLGAAVQNLWGDIKLGSEAEHLPSTWRMGASRVFALPSSDITGAADVVKREGEPAYVRLGAEFLYNKLLALRAGYEFKNSLADDNTIRFGCGLAMKAISFDYALVPYKSLGTTHRFSVAYHFGGKNAGPEAKQEDAKPAGQTKAAEAKPLEQAKPDTAKPAISPAPVQPAADTPAAESGKAVTARPAEAIQPAAPAAQHVPAVAAETPVPATKALDTQATAVPANPEPAIAPKNAAMPATGDDVEISADDLIPAK